MSYENRQAAAAGRDGNLNRALQRLDVTVTVTPEWEVVFGLLDGGWPGTPTDADRLAYMTFLNDLDHRTIARALRQLALRGQKYRPTPAEVRAAVPDRPLEYTPEAEAAWTTVLGLAEPKLYESARRMWLDPLRLAGELDRLLVIDGEGPITSWVERRYLALLTTLAQNATDYLGVTVLASLPGWCPGTPALHAIQATPEIERETA